MVLVTETAREHAYLVARGVRPLALVGHCASQPATLRRVRRALDRLACDGAVPFVLDRGDGFTDFGYAAAPWALDLYTWAVQSQKADDSMTSSRRHQIIGLLLGYSITAISDFEMAVRASTSASVA